MTCISAVFAAIELPAMQRDGESLLATQRGTEHTLKNFLALNSRPNSSSIAIPLAPLHVLSVVTADIQALAHQNGLMVLSVSYRPQTDATRSDITRIEITAKLRGGYVPLKKVLADLMRTYASLAMDSVAIRRDRALDAMLDIEVRWTLLCRKQS